VIPCVGKPLAVVYALQSPVPAVAYELRDIKESMATPWSCLSQAFLVPADMPGLLVLPQRASAHVQ
jgi:hypothetical protein